MGDLIKVGEGQLQELLTEHFGLDAAIAWDRDFNSMSLLDGLSIDASSSPQWMLLNDWVSALGAVCADPSLYDGPEYPRYDGCSRWLYAARILFVLDATDDLGGYWIDASLLHGPERPMSMDMNARRALREERNETVHAGMF